MLSIVVPVLNEDESLETLHAEISKVVSEHALDVEMILVDDGSTDGSWDLIEKVAQRDERVRGIRFRRNFGKAAALTAAMRSARGELILMMDADLQDNPKEIPRFLEKLDEGYDVVNGWKERRLDPWHKVYPSKVFNGMIGLLTGLWLHDHNCGFKLFRREVSDEIRLYGEMHRFIPVLAHSRGYRVAEITVHHRERQYGRSKYGLRRFIRGFLDLLTVKFLTGFGQRPQHMLGGIGLIFFVFGVLGLGFLSLVWICTNVLNVGSFAPIGDRPLLAYSIAATLLGGQAISLGLLAELIVAYTGKEADTFSIRSRTEPQEPDGDSTSRSI